MTGSEGGNIDNVSALRSQFRSRSRSRSGRGPRLGNLVLFEIFFVSVCLSVFSRYGRVLVRLWILDPYYPFPFEFSFCGHMGYPGNVVPCACCAWLDVSLIVD